MQTHTSRKREVRTLKGNAYEVYSQYKYNDEESVCLFVVKLVDKIETTSIYII